MKKQLLTFSMLFTIQTYTSDFPYSNDPISLDFATEISIDELDWPKESQSIILGNSGNYTNIAETEIFDKDKTSKTKRNNTQLPVNNNVHNYTPIQNHGIFLSRFNYHLLPMENNKNTDQNELAVNSITTENNTKKRKRESEERNLNPVVKKQKFYYANKLKNKFKEPLIMPAIKKAILNIDDANLNKSKIKKILSKTKLQDLIYPTKKLLNLPVKTPNEVLYKELLKRTKEQ